MPDGPSRLPGPHGPDAERAWFEAMLDAHARDVHRYLARRHRGADVEDLAAEVFLIAWRRRAEIPAGSHLPWLYRTAWNVLANHRRKVVPMPTGDLPDVPDDLDVADRVIEDLALARAWSRLSGRDREVLRPAAWEGLDGRELAQALGVTVGGAGAALSRARRRLADAWSDETTDQPATQE